MKKQFALVCGVSLLAHLSAQAQFSISPLATFGGGDGWLTPTEYNGLLTSGDNRGMAFGNGHLYLQSGTGAAPTVRVLNAASGAEVGTLDVTGLTGGARVLTGLGVGGDGAIYGGNLQTALSGTATYKVYKWTTESSTPTVAYSGNPLTGARLGDSFAVTGSGLNTRIGAGFAASPAIAGNNGYAIIDPNVGTHSQVVFAGTPPAAGDFRLGIAFGANNSTVFGDQGNVATDTRLTTYSEGTGTFVASLTLSAAAERMMQYTVVNGLPVLATLETGSGATTGTVRVYDMSDPITPVLLVTGKNQTGTVTANGNGTGAIAWGDVIANEDGTATANLFAMNSNNGIEAFVVLIPEPTSFALAGLGMAALLIFRRQRQ
jgi:hypothetical protein